MKMTKANLARLAATLRDLHGPKPLVASGDPLAELILTVLSQATNDRNRDRAFALLQAALPTWQEVVDAPTDAVAEAIVCGGLAKNKAPRIQAIIRAVGSADELRRRLEQADVADAMGYLCSLPGVGPKTAACTLLFALAQPAFPVDTHIHRIALRLGLVPPKTDAVKTQAAFNEALEADPDALYDLHVNTLMHGREYCRPTNPRCDICPLRADCRHATGEEKRRPRRNDSSV